MTRFLLLSCCMTLTCSVVSLASLAPEETHTHQQHRMDHLPRQGKMPPVRCTQTGNLRCAPKPAYYCFPKRIHTPLGRAPHSAAACTLPCNTLGFLLLMAGIPALLVTEARRGLPSLLSLASWCLCCAVSCRHQVLSSVLSLVLFSC